MQEETKKLKLPFLGNYLNLVVTITLFILIAVVASFGTWYLLGQTVNNTVTVSGSATSTVKNEIATFTATMTIKDPDKGVASNLANTKLGMLLNSIKTFDIAADDIRTTSINTYQDSYWDPSSSRSIPSDWVVSQTLEITLRDKTRASELAGFLNSYESTSVYGPNFTVDEKKLEKGAILADAMVDAKKKADAIAAQTGRKVGKVITVNEGYSYNPIYGRYDAAYMGVGGGGMPIESGTSDITATVTVTYQLN